MPSKLVPVKTKHGLILSAARYMASILIHVLQKYTTALYDMQKINMKQMLNKMKQIGGNNPKLKEVDRKGKKSG